MNEGTTCVEPLAEASDDADASWPADVQLVMSAIEAGSDVPAVNRRAVPRRRYRVRAWLRLFSDPPGSPPWLLYTRDAGERGIGFVTPHRLPLGYGGTLDIAAPDGTLVNIHCSLNRCREAAAGWFEGALQFNRPQYDFAPVEED